MREEIERLGGEIRFGSASTDVRIEAGRVRGLTVARGTGAEASTEELRADHVVMALGHSARDTFAMLHERGVHIEAKPFSIGFRIEHPQGADRPRALRAGTPAIRCSAPPTTSWCTTRATAARSTASACARAARWSPRPREPGRVVTNGMSQYSRNERNANAGIVVGIDAARTSAPPGSSGAVGPLDGIALQRDWESRAFVLGGGDYRAPGQLVGDFLAGRASTALGSVVPSYKPGVTPTDLAAPGREPARLRDRGDPRGAAGVRPQDRGLRDGTTRC